MPLLVFGLHSNELIFRTRRHDYTFRVSACIVGFCVCMHFYYISLFISVPEWVWVCCSNATKLRFINATARNRCELYLTHVLLFTYWYWVLVNWFSFNLNALLWLCVEFHFLYERAETHACFGLNWFCFGLACYLPKGFIIYLYVSWWHCENQNNYTKWNKTKPKWKLWKRMHKTSNLDVVRLPMLMHIATHTKSHMQTYKWLSAFITFRKFVCIKVAPNNRNRKSYQLAHIKHTQCVCDLIFSSAFFRY